VATNAKVGSEVEKVVAKEETKEATKIMVLS
jgi:hypothetical protein